MEKGSIGVLAEMDRTVNLGEPAPALSSKVVKYSHLVASGSVGCLQTWRCLDPMRQGAFADTGAAAASFAGARTGPAAFADRNRTPWAQSAAIVAVEIFVATSVVAGVVDIHGRSQNADYYEPRSCLDCSCKPQVAGSGTSAGDVEGASEICQPRVAPSPHRIGCFQKKMAQVDQHRLGGSGRDSAEPFHVPCDCPGWQGHTPWVEVGAIHSSSSQLALTASWQWDEPPWVTGARRPWEAKVVNLLASSPGSSNGRPCDCACDQHIHPWPLAIQRTSAKRPWSYFQ